ncbi:mucin-5AC [Xyrichtys novacula]|uniref:Mucin-5AC n=1 Tax=Xyrichtys novacula TaxID=13765 RepID=A0AAV1EYS0_XYRNO|nr:mucin-5AC [Xyrichtys novacula]
MQLHACLLLLIITTDKSWASSQLLCGGNFDLDQDPAGRFNLTLPGLFPDSTDRPSSVTHLSEEILPITVCTWTLSLPPGRTVLLKLVWLESNSSISVHCVPNREDLVLEGLRGSALLSGCDRNKATLSWTGPRQSSNVIELSYYVQEDDPHSSEDHTNSYSNQDLLHRSQTGTSFTRSALIGEEIVSGEDEGKGRLYEGLDSSSGPYSSSQDQGLLRPTSSLQGLASTWKADRETLPLPEEGPNNGADTSGAAHLADRPTSARGRTRPYFQPTLSAESLFHGFKEENTERSAGDEQTTLTHETESHFNTSDGTDIQKSTTTHPSFLSSDTQTIVSSSPLTTRVSGPLLTPHFGADSGPPGEKSPPSWRSHRSTAELNSDPTSSVTANPLKTSTEGPEEASTSANTDTEPTAVSLPSSSQDPMMAFSPTTAASDNSSTVRTVEAASFHPNTSTNGSLGSDTPDFTSPSAAFESSEKLGNTEMLHSLTSPSSILSQTDFPQSTESITQTPYTQTDTESTQSISAAVSSLPDGTKDDDWTLSFTDFSTPGAAGTSGDVVQSSAVNRNTESYTLDDNVAANSQTSASLLSTSTTPHSSTDSQTLQTHSTSPGVSLSVHTTSPLSSATSQPAAHTPLLDRETVPTTSETSTVRRPSSHTPFPSSTDAPLTQKHSGDHVTATQASPPSVTTANRDKGDREVEERDESPSAGSPSNTTPHTIQESLTTLRTAVFNSKPTQSSTTSQTPKYYIVPDQPAAIGVESIELLLQIIVEESRSDLKSNLEEDATAWMEPYLQRAPGFSRLLGVWSSGHAVQSLVQFKTSQALEWLGRTGPSSLLERTGLTQAVRDGRKFRSSKITNITLGGVQADVCDWLLQCPAGLKCVSQPGSSNYSCSSVCHFDHCHHHGICTHHPGQLPVCRCLVGEDFWYMGQRCDVRMTRARLVGACLAILLIMVTVIGVLAFVAVRRYKAALIQAKVDQTRSSYRRFNHFDELSGRFWLRSWAGSADSLDNPAFTRSDELLHLRALDRPCCYHDDTLSLASTCPSHGTRINTIYPHSSQYGWRGSEVSVGDGVLDSGKASDLSVCSWPVEPIQWTPFPILQQLAAHRTPAVRVSRPRSYCEGMELVDMKSWTA